LQQSAKHIAHFTSCKECANKRREVFSPNSTSALVSGVSGNSAALEEKVCSHIAQALHTLVHTEGFGLFISRPVVLSYLDRHGCMCNVRVYVFVMRGLPLVVVLC